ncbi:MAG: PD40 domain-containing protein [Acidobacteriia bacterium]|nr:PD40 domain-containing protein [Terriglobia bacterium]
MKLTSTLLLAASICLAQESDIVIKIMKGDRSVVAVPDMRGTGDAQNHMGVFNRTLFSDLQDSGYFTMAPKSMYPVQLPQQPTDFKPPLPPPAARPGAAQPTPVSQGPWLTDWSGPPVSANYLTVGYSAVQNDRIVLFAWLFNVNQPDLANAQVFGKLYFGTVDETGARKVAHEFAADILAKFGALSLSGSKIYFSSDRTGANQKEIWGMEHDGSNQKQITQLRSISISPAVSPDGTRLAFTTFAGGSPSIMLFSLESGRMLRFYNQRASLNATPTFTPDGKQVIFSSTAAGGGAQLYICDADGSGFRRLTSSPSIDIEPKVNPRTGAEVVFTSGRSGPPQIYKMNMDGANAIRLTSGEGDAVNAAWHPDGQHIAFSWTKGYDPGSYNIFVMDVATRQYVQLTHGQGRNENPTWAPDGRHLVFSSNRSGSNQIWTMLADGTQARQLTTQGRNGNPVWSK